MVGQSFRAFVIGVAMVLFVSGAVQPVAAQESVVGTWRLVSYERVNPTSGEVFERTFADASGGVIIYSPKGRMSVLLKADNFLGYTGRYTLTRDKIVHHVELSNIPDFVGADLDRTVKFSGRRMTLRANSMYSDEKYTLVWERIE